MQLVNLTKATFSSTKTGDPNTDCFDCDPLQQSSGKGCTACINAGGRYCWFSNVCVSPDTATAVPGACLGAWAINCSGGGSELECNIFNDACSSSLDLKCDAGTSCE